MTEVKLSRKMQRLPTGRALAIATGITVLAACTSHNEGRRNSDDTVVAASASASTSTSSIPSPTQDPLALRAEAIEPTLKAYGQKLNEKHAATIAMDVCVAWKNEGKGMTVTYNPGVAQLPAASNVQGEFYVWGNRVQSSGFPQPSLIISDGPGKFYADGQTDNEFSQVNIIFYQKSGKPDLSEHISERRLSPLVQSDDGTGYFTDIATKQPVLRTVLLESVLDPSALYLECESLRS